MGTETSTALGAVAGRARLKERGAGTTLAGGALLHPGVTTGGGGLAVRPSLAPMLLLRAAMRASSSSFGLPADSPPGAACASVTAAAVGAPLDELGPVLAAFADGSGTGSTGGPAAGLAFASAGASPGGDARVSPPGVADQRRRRRRLTLRACCGTAPGARSATGKAVW